MNPRSVVETFVNAWNEMAFESVIALLSDDIFYHNIPKAPLVGIDEVTQYLKGAWQFTDCHWEMINLAVDGANVLTERVDRFVINNANVALPVMGVFVINDNKIEQWRDYFDLADYEAQLCRANDT